jgi:hypothetical protein
MAKRKVANKKPAADKTPIVKIEPYLQNLKVILTKEQIADRADRAAQLLQDRDQKEEEQKATAKHAKSVIETIEAELRRLSSEVRTKATYEDVNCERRFVYESKKVQEWRLDTGEMISERDMNEHEKQREFGFSDDKGEHEFPDEFGGDEDGKAAE